MINLDYTYCSGYLCPIAEKCKRYCKEAFESKEPLWWMSAKYNNKKDKCINFEKK